MSDDASAGGRRLGPLEVVTHAENQRRMGAAQTACRRAGHDWSDPSNVYVRRDGRRWCAACAREKNWWRK